MENISGWWLRQKEMEAGLGQIKMQNAKCKITNEEDIFPKRTIKPICPFAF
jgi:hypothetical protein